MSTCPFCQSSLNSGAIVCHNCNAKYGYKYGEKFYVSKEELIMAEIKGPAFITLISIIFEIIAYQEVFNLGVSSAIAFIAFFTLIYGAFKLFTGLIAIPITLRKQPLWWKNF